MQSSRFQAGSAKNSWCAPNTAGHSIRVNAVDSIMIMMQHVLIKYTDWDQHAWPDGAAQMPCLSMHAIKGDIEAIIGWIFRLDKGIGKTCMLGTSPLQQLLSKMRAPEQ